MKFNPERFLMQTMYKETSIDVLKDAAKLTGFVNEVLNG